MEIKRQNDQEEEKREAYRRFRRAIMYLFQSFTLLVLAMTAGTLLMMLIIWGGK
jgi:ABC-type methionine transport system ATPase subunit